MLDDARVVVIHDSYSLMYGVYVLIVRVVCVYIYKRLFFPPLSLSLSIDRSIDRSIEAFGSPRARRQIATSWDGR